MKHTPQDLLAAVGVDWHKDYAIVQCPQCKNHRFYCVTGSTWHRFDCSRPDTSNVEPTYTGPALGTPELDAVLLVEGVKLCRCNWQLYDDVHDAVYKLNEVEIDKVNAFALEWIIFHCTQPGHALAAAIAEVRG